MKKRIIAALSAVALGAGGLLIGSAASASADPGDTADNPIIVTDAGQVPEDAVKTVVVNDCITTTQFDWAVTTPGTPAQDGDLVYMYQERTRERIPGEHHDAVTHQEYKYSRTVKESHTEYKFAKYTHTKTRTWVEGTPATPDLWWNWSPNKTKGPQDYVPNFPTDSRGTWQGPHENGGPQQSTYGTFKTSDRGKSSYFHREQGTPGTDGHWGEWSDYGDWSKWSPETHVSWENTDQEALGVPEFHSQGGDRSVQWYRQWQARNTGETREVVTGSYVETTDWVREQPEGEGWTQIEEQTVVDHDEYTDEDTFSEWSEWADVREEPFTSEPEIPADTEVHEYGQLRSWRATEDIPATPDVTVFYRYVETSGEECPTSTPTPTPTPTPPTTTPPVTTPPVTTPPVTTPPTHTNVPPAFHTPPVTPPTTTTHTTKVPTVIDAGLSGDEDNGSTPYAGIGLVALGLALASIALLSGRRSKSER